VIRMHIQHIL